MEDTAEKKKATTSKTAKKTITKTESKPAISTKKERYDDHHKCTVRNGFDGVLVYVNRKTGEEFRWDAFGDEQEMEFCDLLTARNSSKVFFERNWFLFDDPELISQLNVQAYYENALKADEFDSVFDMDVEQAISVVSKLSAGQKQVVGLRAREFIQSGKIDSKKMILALEQALGMTLEER